MGLKLNYINGTNSINKKNKKQKTNIMEAKELTPLQRIEILENVLQKLESGDNDGGLCYQITVSANELFEFFEISAKKIIPLLTFKNAKKVTDVKYNAVAGSHWWNYDYESYDFENRIKFVNWMIKMEKSLLNK